MLQNGHYGNAINLENECLIIDFNSDTIRNPSSPVTYGCLVTCIQSIESEWHETDPNSSADWNPLGEGTHKSSWIKWKLDRNDNPNRNCI